MYKKMEKIPLEQKNVLKNIEKKKLYIEKRTFQKQKKRRTFYR